MQQTFAKYPGFADSSPVIEELNVLVGLSPAPFTNLQLTLSESVFN